ncbi:B12-binding domain-containing radical SAM protein [Synechococcus sp. CS-1332]|uniref:B12-binding domain-containing radical SAM protein n=1 Tax=Synechococcus sp. CS-1332 TaxID=2847972 RepID=UPI00223B6046|nr:B12-binding domain-containing radical SAM protein [Synechococcus sp. CS-1332]MCT0208833.1 B12-binding domain-containing radical SAM protein [Synechococcus sp. CS-1332]
MRTLFIYPEFPKTFWSYEKILELVNRKVLLPPLGMVTVAALLPQTWEMKLVDRNVREVTEAEWNWAELVVISGMIVQKADMAAQIARAKQRGLPVAVGGPFASSTPDAPELQLADFKVLDEGEITLPMFIEAIERGDSQGRFSADGEKPDVTGTPIPRFDLLELDAYDSMSVQFSRGCPFQCEFCDIIVLYGRKPRTKAPDQLVAELQYLYDLGWRRSIFLVDDNFIGNKRNAKLLLPEIKRWQIAHGYPFSFATEASVDLAADEEMLEMMAEARFDSVFLGIETPDEASLETARKLQNTRSSLEESVDRITAYGIRVMAGFIIGFDGEKQGAGDRIVEFVSRTGIPAAMMGMLQALPNTGLWHRLEKEGRLVQEKTDAKGVNQTNLLNFVPTRPIRQIANEYVDAFCRLYEPNAYIDRVTHYYLKMGQPRWQQFVPAAAFGKASLPTWTDVRALLIVIWRQGLKRDTRGRFWRSLLTIARKNPNNLEQFLVTLAHNEHFQEYRGVVTREIQDQLAALPPEPPEGSRATSRELQPA